MTVPFLLSDDFQEILDAAMVGDMFVIDGRDDDFAPWFECEPVGDSLFVSEDATYTIIAADAEQAVVLLFHSGSSDPVGFYADMAVWIDPPHRGRGLGCEMIIAAADHFGKEPFLGGNNDPREGLGFSVAGFDCHVHAVELARERHVQRQTLTPSIRT